MSVRDIALGVCLFTCSIVSAQTILISDDSLAGSPVSIAGTITFRGNDSPGLECSITAHNHTTKSIIMSVVEMKLNKPTGEPGEFLFERDHFFKQLAISSPKSDFLISSDCNMGHEIDVRRISAPPEAHAKVVFLQFEDGSTWGDRKVGNRLMKQRLAVLAFLKSLKSVYETDGPRGLEKAIAKEQQPGTMVRSKLTGLRMIRNASGIRAVAHTIDQNLATAKLRKAALLK